ncbi:hypothetical protein BC829DRAFT_397868, partial [Chytridium lagenaria]
GRRRGRGLRSPLLRRLLLMSPMWIFLRLISPLLTYQPSILHPWTLRPLTFRPLTFRPLTSQQSTPQQSTSGSRHPHYRH